MYPKFIRIHKISGPCKCNATTRHNGTSPNPTWSSCAADADVLMVGVENGETFAVTRCLAHAIAGICDTGARSGPVYDHYVLTGRLPKPEPMIEE